METGTLNIIYNVSYFIKKFEAIPESSWTTNFFIDNITGACCAQGHCGMRFQNAHKVWDAKSVKQVPAKLKEGYALFTLFKKARLNVADVNNGDCDKHPQPTAKKRIISALYHIKAMQEPKYENITKELAVLPANETSDIILRKVNQPA